MLSVSVRTEHDHLHRHDTRGHGGACSCRTCRYDGTLGDLLVLRSAVEGIGRGAADDDLDPEAAAAAGRAPAGSPARTVERLNDELRNFAAHRSPGFSIYA